MSELEKKVDVSQLSDEELDRLLKERQEKKRREAEKKQVQYETDRDALVARLVDKARKLSESLAEFKAEAIREFKEFGDRAAEYGEIRSNSKGGYSLRHSQSLVKVVYGRNIKIEYDERADHAAGLIKDFLSDMIKKRDKDAYEMILTLLEKNKAGDFNPSMIGSLIKKRNRFNDPRWIRAIELFEECHNQHLISMGISFYTKNSQGKDVLIPLSLSSIEVD